MTKNEECMSDDEYMSPGKYMNYELRHIGSICKEKLRYNVLAQAGSSEVLS